MLLKAPYKIRSLERAGIIDFWSTIRNSQENFRMRSKHGHKIMQSLLFRMALPVAVVVKVWCVCVVPPTTLL